MEALSGWALNINTLITKIPKGGLLPIRGYTYTLALRSWIKH